MPPAISCALHGLSHFHASCILALTPHVRGQLTHHGCWGVPLPPARTQNPYALLRNALPISNKPIRTIQLALESISEDLRVPGVRFAGVSKSVNNSLKIVTKNQKDILKDVAPQNADKAAALLAELQSVRAILPLPRLCQADRALQRRCRGPRS
jgi:hypothetical protein